jgi:hypothetical protein
LSDAAGNGNMASSALSIGFDTLVPTVSVTAATTASSGSATVSSSEAGSVYLVSSSVSVTGVSSITSANGSLWNTVVVTANTSTSLSATGLSDGNYYAYAADTAGNLSTQSVSYVTIRTVSCANGGVCSLGEIGPGGGFVFYVNASGFSCGQNLTDICNYLELAPRNWLNGCIAVSGCAIDGVGTSPSYWSRSDYSSALVSPATESAIGTGLYNTILINAQNGECSTPLDVSTASCNYGAGKARAYRGGGKADWAVPSQGELEAFRVAYSAEMKNWSKGPTDYSLERSSYMTSTEASSQTFFGYTISGVQWAWSNNTSFQKYNPPSSYRVRPIRAFAQNS